jgi:cytidine deaminase
MTTSIATPTPQLSCDQILKIAREDAEKAYRDLSRYNIGLAMKATVGTWIMTSKIREFAAAVRTTSTPEFADPVTQKVCFRPPELMAKLLQKLDA